MNRVQLELLEGSLFNVGEAAALALECELMVRRLDALHWG